jgi:integrase
VALWAITGTGKEGQRTFHGPNAIGEATRYARDQAARLRLGLVAKAQHRTATAVLRSDYLADLEARGRSASYLRDVDQVLTRLEQAVPDLAAAGVARRLERWLAELPMAGRRYGSGEAQAATGERASPRTRNKYLIAVRSLCAWAIERELLAEDPTKGLREAKEPERLREQFTLGELRTMAQAFDHSYHLRFVVTFYLGLRSDEAVALRWSALDVEGRVWEVTGKGDKQRLAHVPDECLDLLRGVHGIGAGQVFGDRMRFAHDSQHRRELHSFCRDLGIDPAGRSPHSLRHSYAGVMTATGQPSLLLAAHMGHASTQTTSGYTKLATRYFAGVRTWKRGQIELLTGWSVARSRGQVGDQSVGGQGRDEAL